MKIYYRKGCGSISTFFGNYITCQFVLQPLFGLWPGLFPLKPAAFREAL